MRRIIKLLKIAIVALIVAPTLAQPPKLVERAPDPHGTPRPARDARDVPLRTSIYFELAIDNPRQNAGSVAVTVQDQTGKKLELMHAGPSFTNGASGWVKAKDDKSLAIYLETGRRLQALSRYTVHVSRDKSEIASWSFTTDSAPSVHPLQFHLDLKSKPVHWHGQFFSGICNVIFCSQADNYGPTYELMAEARQQHPRDWSLQRDFWLTGTDSSSNDGFSHQLPNIVRERETRRITAIEPRENVVLLRVEDFFGHEQYGIRSGRPVSDDYHPGDQVLIADGVHNALTKVIDADNAAATVTVAPCETPKQGWKIAYTAPPPQHENPDAPGLFPSGGCYLRKFNPSGTACYYWGRLDKEWDLAVRKYGKRVIPNFADAPSDLSRDGKSWNTVKDYAQWHEVAKTMAGHIIDRYGKDSLGFTWSIFNEPDLWILFWHASWDDLQIFYDYTTDAILRAFEDRGYDSSKVFIGGLELGGVFGTNLRLNEFLAHCSPKAQAKGALPLNAAYADHRLDGKRSRRVEQLGAGHQGKGSPCDFISIHSYNRSEVMAAKLAKAKEMALQIDPDFYKTLWVDSHESCPDWMPPPDQAASDSYLGDGYFPTWCADVVHRQLARAASDPRYSYGETILTVWPPPSDFVGLNAVTRIIHCKEDSGVPSTTTVPMPIFHALNLLSDMGNDYWTLPEQHIDGHIVTAFASRDNQGVVRILLYAHAPADTQSRSDAGFRITLNIEGIGGHDSASVTQYQIDRQHNSPFQLIKTLGKPPFTVVEMQKIQTATQCQPTAQSNISGKNGNLQVSADLAGNGCNFLIIGPVHDRQK